MILEYHTIYIFKINFKFMGANMDIKIEKIKTNENKNTAFWIIEENDFQLIVEINYIDIYSSGYVYDINAYCLTSGIKIVYQRVKSYRNLLVDSDAIKDYFLNSGELCENMSDFGFYRKKITKKEYKLIKEKIIY